MRTSVASHSRSAAFGVQAQEMQEIDPNDDKPWAAWPEGETFHDTIKIAWGATADEAIARWGALYYGIERKYQFKGRQDMHAPVVEGSP
jgi:hypothetical protein